MSAVSQEKLRLLLDSRVFGMVATVQPDGSPQQSVVWLTRDGDDLLFFVAVGSRKERNLRRDPRVSVLVSPTDAPYSYAAIRGTVRFEPDSGPALRDELSLKYVGLSYAEHIAQTPAAAHPGAITTVRVIPDRVTGRL